MFDLGNNLREARHRRQIDLAVAEQDTKIRSKYLAALENEDFDILPGSVFARGFLRTYSQYLGLDAQLFIDEYNSRFGRFEEAEEQSGPALGHAGMMDHVSRGRRTMRWVVIGSLIVVAVLAWLGLRAPSNTPTAPEPSREVVTTPPSATSMESAVTHADRSTVQPAQPAAHKPGTAQRTKQ